MATSFIEPTKLINAGPG